MQASSGSRAARCSNSIRISASCSTDDRRPRRRSTSCASGSRASRWVSGDGGAPARPTPRISACSLVDGVLAREVVLGDTISTELLGPGGHHPALAHRRPATAAAAGDPLERARPRSARRCLDRRLANLLAALSGDQRGDRGPARPCAHSGWRSRRRSRSSTASIAACWPCSGNLAERWGKVVARRHRRAAGALAPADRRSLAWSAPADGLDGARRAGARRAGRPVATTGRGYSPGQPGERLAVRA